MGRTQRFPGSSLCEAAVHAHRLGGGWDRWSAAALALQLVAEHVERNHLVLARSSSSAASSAARLVSAFLTVRLSSSAWCGDSIPSCCPAV